MSNLIIRKYQPQDEKIVKKICFDNSLYGHSIKKYIKNPELITEAFVGYYLRYEKENILIAEVNEKVAGYLTGCLDTRKYIKIYMRKIFPRLFWLFVSRGYLFQINSYKAAYTGIVSGLIWGRVHRRIIDSYPAHFHINLDWRFQGQGIGSKLIKRFIEILKKKKIKGIHLDTASSEAKKFFEKNGFKVLLKQKMPSFFDLKSHTLWIMGTKLNN